MATGDQRPSQKPGFKTRVGPLDFGCAHYQWDIAWNIPTPASQDGYVIQEIISIQKIQGLQDVTLHFWEAWPIKKGETTSSIAQRQVWDDSWSAKFPHKGQNGTITMSGLAIFFEGPLPPDFKPNNRETLQVANDLPTSKNMPVFWQNGLKNGAGLKRTLEITWDCRAAPGTTTVIAKADDKGINVRKLWGPPGK